MPPFFVRRERSERRIVEPLASRQRKEATHVAKRRIAAVVVIALTTVLVGTALALSDISFVTGTIASYDFGGFGPGYPVPGTVQIQAFTMAPGEWLSTYPADQ